MGRMPDIAQQFVDVDQRAYERGYKAAESHYKKANLGMATNRELLAELSARIEVQGPGLEYRTVGHT